MVRHWEIHISTRRISAFICYLVCGLLSANQFLGQATTPPALYSPWEPRPQSFTPPIPPVNQIPNNASLPGVNLGISPGSISLPAPQPLERAHG